MKAYRIRRNPDEIKAGGAAEPTYLFPNTDKIEATPDDEITKQRAAGLLGVTVADIEHFLTTGRLRRNPDSGRIAVDDLKDLVEDADEVELELTEKGAGRPTARRPEADNKAPASAAGKKASAAKLRPADVDDEDDEAGYLEAKCPGCKEKLAIAREVKRFACPSCGMTLAVDDQDEERPARKLPTATNPKRFLGVFRR